MPKDSFYTLIVIKLYDSVQNQYVFCKIEGHMTLILVKYL